MNKRKIDLNLFALHFLLFQQLAIPTARYSNSSLFQQLAIPTARYSNSSLFQQLAIPTARYSNSSLFQQLAIPTARYSNSSIFQEDEKWICSIFSQLDAHFSFYKKTNFTLEA